jgi:hypothetical protein
MVVEDIERIKREYTDKYVAVDAERPELARFRDVVGQVKTVNMSGRALVEFIDFHLNIGWHDIDVDYLKIVDKPAPKAEKPAARKPAEAAPAAKKQVTFPEGKKLSPLEMARMQVTGKKAGDAPAPAEKPKPAKPAGGKMSVAEMLAAARAEKSGGTAALAPAAKAAAPPKPEPTAEPTPEPSAPAPAKAAAGDIAKVDRKSMSVADMIAYCREKDAR